MLGFDSELGTSGLRLWAAAGSAAALMTFVAFSLLWRPAAPTSRTLQAVLVLAPAALGAVMVWAFLGRGDLSDRGAERRALELRGEELGARALAPGSPLACLDGVAGEKVEAACEKALFATPASVASASAYVAERLSLLSSMSNYAKRGGVIDDVMSPLRRSLETDRFGFLAHVLVTRDDCTSQSCKPLGVLHDPSRVRNDMSAGTLDHYLEHYLPVWAAASDGAAAEGAQLSYPAAQSSAASAHRLVDVDFPSAASIPAVSIMNPEPTKPASPGAAAAVNAAPPAAAPHHSRKQANGGAPASSGTTTTEPIWPEPTPPAPAAQPAAASANAAPLQLTPPSSAAARTQ
ncbi:MAG TPA: hypothetical protein VMV19_01170 [Xanthobacteraceae bacterium]|nr:hypothetical protein [Xanthobacteraceae bacterium]